ncbi:uncharacterized protein LOC123307447 isoform X1 [Coccinella septempunctata]|uniref:uncharacterized protein LOC123307447 isoform X1 n=1 Tax=Coccinella septempunctata TaxID=41139 RepID=UPI001D07B3E3|nr:uncharacterized protein LOC123307447 isoform X1 [Coccinella septempunctata]
MAAYYWVDTRARNGVPSTALRGGTDSDGDAIYVGRAFHDGDWLPAKVIPNKDVAYIAYGGEEHSKCEYQVLCEQRFDWVSARDGEIPDGAVEGGRTCDGEPLYIGRAHHHGSLTVGKVRITKIEQISSQLSTPFAFNSFLTQALIYSS